MLSSTGRFMLVTEQFESHTEFLHFCQCQQQALSSYRLFSFLLLFMLFSKYAFSSLDSLTSHQSYSWQMYINFNLAAFRYLIEWQRRNECYQYLQSISGCVQQAEQKWRFSHCVYLSLCFICSDQHVKYQMSHGVSSTNNFLCYWLKNKCMYIQTNRNSSCL